MIGERREYRKGWAVQSIRLAAGNVTGRRRNWHDPLPKSLKRSYVKIWRKTEGGWSVVDRALTQKAAMRRVRLIIERGEL